MKYSTDIVVIDLEASCASGGLNEIANSNIIDIGAVRLDKRTLEVKDQFAELVKPKEVPITSRITSLTGITAEMVASCDDFGQVGRRFAAWFGNRNRAMLAAFGAYYDIPLLRKEFGTFDLDFGRTFVGAALDIRALAMAWLAENNRSTTGVTLQGTLERMGVNLDLQWHRALVDARGAAAILQFHHLGQVLV